MTHLPMGYWPDSNHAASWSVTDYLLANLIDAVRELTYVTVRINAPKNAHIKKPDPHFRPGSRSPNQRKTRWADLPRLLGAKRPDS